MLIDTSGTIRMNREFIETSDWAMQNIRIANSAVDVLRTACELKLDQPDEICVLRLGVRLINSAGAAGDSSLSGYYQPAAAHIRDLIEIGFLLDYFGRDLAEVTRWRTIEKDKRWWEFRAKKLRKALDALDGNQHKLRDDAYAFFSSHGTHADPDSVGLNSPGNWTRVGPFPDRERVLGLSFDLARYLAAATQYFVVWLLKQRAVERTAIDDRLVAYINEFHTKLDVLAKRQPYART